MSAARNINWSALSSKLKPDTMASLNAFRRRHADLQKTLTELKEQDKPLDFSSYRSVLKNTKVIDNAEKAFKNFKPVSYDLSEQIKVIEQAHVTAVKEAKATEEQVKTEIAELNVLLSNIDQARPLEELTVDDVVQAAPEIDQTVEKMVKRSQWLVPGYYEKFGEFKVGF